MLRQVARLADGAPDVGVFGGPNLTPGFSTTVQHAQGEALASLIGAGPLRHRFRHRGIGPADDRHLMLCNLAIRRAVLPPFPDDLVTAEENAVLALLAHAGVGMRTHPAMAVHHERRGSHRAFARQVRGWGIGRGQLSRRHPRTVRPWHFAPVVLATYLLALPALVLALGAWISAPAAVYAGVVGGWSLGRPRRASSRAACVVLLHLGYAVGVVQGLLRTGRMPSAGTARWREDP